MSKHKHICTAVLLLCAIAIANNQTILSGDLSQTDAINNPKLLNYQGRLTNLAGTAVADSTYSITFRLYNVSTSGSAFWTETQNVQTNQGIFNVLLGSNTPIDTIPQSGNCYLEMQVNPNPAMSPRIRLVSSAYAYLSKKADTANYALSANITYVDSARISANAHKLQGKDTIALSTKYVDEGQINAITNPMIVDNAVTSAKIQDGTIQVVDLAFTPATRPLTPPVSTTEIADNAVTSGKIQDGTIATADIADNAVTLAKHADNSVNSAKIVDGSIGTVDLNFTPATRPLSPGVATAEIADGAVTQIKIAAGVTLPPSGPAGGDLTGTYPNPTITTNAVTTTKIADNAVTTAKITDNAITSGKIQDGTIATADIADGAVTLAKLADNSVNSAKIVDGSVATADIADGAITNPKLTANAITTDKIQNNTILREDVATTFKAPYADTSDYTRNVNINYVDSARVATNAHKLQGKDTIALSNKYVDEGQSNSISSAMIIDNTITRSDVAITFKAPLADTADYARMIPGAIDSARVSADAHRLQGKDTLALSAKFVDEGQPNSVNSAMIQDLTITNADISNVAGITDIKLSGTGALITNLNADMLDGLDATAFALTGHTHASIDSARISANAHKLQGKDTLALSVKFVDEGQANAISSAMIADNAVTSTKIQDGQVQTADIADLNVTTAKITDGAITLAKLADNSVNSAKIQDLTITNADISNVAGITDIKLSGTGALITNFNADMLDGQHATAFALTGHTHASIDSSRVSANAHKLQGKDTIALSAKFVDEGQANAISTAMITDNAVTLAKLAENSVNSVKIVDGSIRGADIAKPCTLIASVSSPGAVMHIRNTGAGHGLRVDSAGNCGVYVYRAGDYGVRVYRAGYDGVYVDSAANVGFYVNRADTGLKVIRARHTGVYVDSAGDDGVRVDRAGIHGVYVDRAGRLGVRVNRASWDGVRVDSAGDYGVYIYRAGYDGVNVYRAGDDGVYVDSAGSSGIWARGYSTCGGKFVAGTAAAEGIIAHSFNSVAGDTAIMAWGKGVATGGWGTSFADGEAPCIVSPEQTMIASGTAKLVNGQISISYPKIFTNNIRTDIPIRITLTPNGNPSGILCVTDKNSNNFSVTLKSVPGWDGDNDITFDWIAIGTLKEPETTPQAKAEWDRMMQEREEKRQKTEQREKERTLRNKETERIYERN